MSKKILLIESDAAFARDMAAAIETRGLEARVTGDGREGLELAKANRPDAIVLCVELPKMSGYSVCNKLKKDDELKHIPLVIISAEATAATFDQHRKLKTHAEDYLLKPFDAAALLQKIAGLVELPPEPAANDTLDEEIVTLDDVEELEALAEPAADAEDLPTEGVGMALGEDEDLKLFDEAFGTLEVPDAAPVEATADAAELLAASLSGADEPSRAVQDAADSADAALEALGLDDVAESDIDAAALLAPPPSPAAPSPERTTDAFHLAPAPPPRPAVIVPPPPPELSELHAVHRAAEAHGASSELQAMQDRVSELRIELARRDEELQRSTADHAEAEQRAEAIARDGAARERAAEGRARAAEERTRAAEEAAAVARADAEARATAAAADAEARVGAAVAEAEERVSAANADADARVSAAVAEADRAVGSAAADAEERVRAARAEAEEAVRAACAEADAAVRAAQADAEEAVRVACQQADDRVGAAEARAAEAEASANAAAERSTAAEERARAAEARADASDASAAEASGRASAAEQRAQAAEASEAAARARAETAEADAAARATELAEAAERAAALAHELDVERARASGYDGELAALRPELEAVRGALVSARGDLDAARNEAERRAAELTKRVAELEAQTARHEERVVKAYQKIKGDEKIREKTRKALAIALQLLEDRPVAPPAAAAVAGEVQPRRE